VEIVIRSDKGGLLSLISHESNDISWLKERLFALLNGKEGIPVKSSHFATVLKFEDHKTGEVYYFKEFHNRGIKDKLMKIIGLTRSVKAYKAGRMLLQKGFRTPIPVALGLEKAFSFIKRNFLVTKEAPGERAHEYFQKRYQPPLSGKMIVEKRDLLAAAGHEIGRLHNTGIFHGDLRLGNIIINGQGVSAGFFLLDNERTLYCRSLSGRRRLKNLVQLNMTLLLQITRTDRLRFLNAYIEENPALLPDKKDLIASITRIMRKRINRRLSGKKCRSEYS
jgi:hypothetical protein